MYHRTYFNANMKNECDRQADLAYFLPFPQQWHEWSAERRLSISRETAIEFLKTYREVRKRNDKLVMILPNVLDEIKSIAISA